VVSLRYPSYAVRHPAHVCWLNHTMREYYDLWPSFRATLSLPNRIKEGTRRRLIRFADRWLFRHNVREVVAQSATIRGRLRRELGIRADVLYPPPPQRPYRCEAYGDYIFAISRLVPLKRMDLLVRALAEPPARHVSAVIAGDGEGFGALQALAGRLGVSDRISFPGRIDEAAMLDHLARCRAVCFTPRDEDYGFVTVEAFASRKPVITCHDSGGPAELVIDGDNGLVVDPSPAAIADAIGRLIDDRALAERLGSAAAARAATMTWFAAVERLVK
jgi:glycosyltransferase involved in cell wall biosynthesis